MNISEPEMVPSTCKGCKGVVLIPTSVFKNFVEPDNAPPSILNLSNDAPVLVLVKN